MSASVHWSSHRSFVWVAVGACAGMGNMVRLPELIGTHGGWRFLLVYGLCLLLVALPLLVAEWSLGRGMRSDLFGGFRLLAERVGARPRWRWLGGFMILTSALTLSYYSVIAGWGLGYVFRVAGGGLTGADAETLGLRFLALTSDPERSLAWHTVFMVATCVVVAQGVRDGLERAALRLVPVSLLLAGGLLVYLAWTRPEAEPWRWLTPEADGYWTASLVLAALRESLLSLILGVGVMIALGSYLPGEGRLVGTAGLVLALDLLLGLLLGFSLYLILLPLEGAVGSGLGLLFQTLPLALSPGLEGVLLGVGFYLLLFMLTLTSAVALLEVVTRFVSERWRTTRVFAATSAATVIWAIGLLSLLSFAADPVLRLEGYTLFQAFSFLTAQVLAPLSVLLVCLFAGRIMPRHDTEALLGGRRSARLLTLLLNYPARVGAIVVLLQSLGIIPALLSLWS